MSDAGIEVGFVERSIVNPRVWIPVTVDGGDSECFLYAEGRSGRRCDTSAGPETQRCALSVTERTAWWPGEES